MRPDKHKAISIDWSNYRGANHLRPNAQLSRDNSGEKRYAVDLKLSKEWLIVRYGTEHGGAGDKI